LEQLQEVDDVEEEWEGLKIAITEAANETIQTQNKTPRSKWWDEECRQIIKRKIEARSKWLQQKTRASYEIYSTKRKEANNLINQKKKKWLNNKILQIEQNNNKNEIKRFYEDIKYFKQPQVILPEFCKDSRGNVILQIEDVLKRWKEYFCNILKPPTISYRINLTTTHISNQDEVEPPTYNEICSVINKLKITKAAGTDNIPAELIRYGGRTLKKRMRKLMLNIWNNEHLPAQWNEGIICPIYKEGDPLNCSNYRPITLLNTAYKIFNILLNNRLTDII
jgi:hypothetical protein